MPALFLPVVLSFLVLAVSGSIALFAFIVGGTARGAPVSPSVFVVFRRAGWTALVSGAILVLSLGALIASY